MNQKGTKQFTLLIIVAVFLITVVVIGYIYYKPKENTEKPINSSHAYCQTDSDCQWTTTQYYLEDGSKSDCLCYNKNFLETAEETDDIFSCLPEHSSKPCVCTDNACQENIITDQDLACADKGVELSLVESLPKYLMTSYNNIDYRYDTATDTCVLGYEKTVCNDVGIPECETTQEEQRFKK